MRTPMLPGPSTITLDQESFKALASEVRVDILKKLDERRQTVTDLSGLLTLSKPTLLEHLEKLQAAGLVKRIDEGRKWIYYELSQKGRRLLHPEKVAIVLALSTAVVLAAAGALMFLLAATSPGITAGGPRSGLANATMAPINSGLLAFTPPYGPVALALFALAAVGAVVALALIWWGNRRRQRFFSELARS